MTENENAGVPAPNPSPAAPSVKPPPSEDELKRALVAFKKRIKLMILDQESHLGGGRPMTAGRKSEIQGIVPPNQFSREVWKELAVRKQLKDMGGGFYALPK